MVNVTGFYGRTKNDKKRKTRKFAFLFRGPYSNPKRREIAVLDKKESEKPQGIKNNLISGEKPSFKRYTFLKECVIIEVIKWHFPFL